MPMMSVHPAGPERSGSTWLFNAVRLLYEDAQQPLDSYWMTHVTTKKLHQRGHRESWPLIEVQCILLGISGKDLDLE